MIALGEPAHYLVRDGILVAIRTDSVKSHVAQRSLTHTQFCWNGVTAGTAQTLESPESLGHRSLESKRCWTRERRSIPKTGIRPTCLMGPLESFADVVVRRRASRKVERSQQGSAVWKRGFNWALALVESWHQLSHSLQSRRDCPGNALSCHFTLQPAWLDAVWFMSMCISFE